MIGKRSMIANMAAGLTLSWLAAVPAHAAPQAAEYFGRVTKPAMRQMREGAARPAIQNPDPAKDLPVKWFESFDDAVASHKPSAADRVIMSRPFNQQAERVQQWIETASTVAKNYRQLSRVLRTMTVPAAMPGVAEYRDLAADWYADAASVYEDLIRPRRPSRTMEELEEAINQIKERASSLSQTNANLKAMDMSLRRTYRVHLAKHEDALQQYVTRR